MDAQSCTQVTLYLGETGGFWVQTGAFVISAMSALWLIAATGKQTRLRATVDLVMHQAQDKEHVAAKKVIRRLHIAKDNSSPSKYLEQIESEERAAILYLLNAYEFAATGIRSGAFDERTYKRLMFSTLRKDFELLQGCIVELQNQTKKKTLFQEFSWLESRWQRCPLNSPWYKELWFRAFHWI